MSKYDNLSLREKSDLFKEYTNAGYTNIGSIKDHYNNYNTNLQLNDNISIPEDDIDKIINVPPVKITGLNINKATKDIISRKKTYKDFPKEYHGKLGASVTRAGMNNSPLAKYATSAAMSFAGPAPFILEFLDDYSKQYDLPIDPSTLYLAGAATNLGSNLLKKNLTKVYHGSPNTFTGKPKPPQSKGYIKNNGTSTGEYGVYTSTNKNYAERYTTNIKSSNPTDPKKVHTYYTDTDKMLHGNGLLFKHNNNVINSSKINSKEYNILKREGYTGINIPTNKRPETIVFDLKNLHTNPINSQSIRKNLNSIKKESIFNFTPIYQKYDNKE